MHSLDVYHAYERKIFCQIFEWYPAITWFNVQYEKYLKATFSTERYYSALLHWFVTNGCSNENNIYKYQVLGLGGAFMRHHWFRFWHVGCSAPSHYLNQHWLIVNWTLGINFREIWNRIIKKYKWKCQLQNGGHFVWTSVCYLTCLDIDFLSYMSVTTGLNNALTAGHWQSSTILISWLSHRQIPRHSFTNMVYLELSMDTTFCHNIIRFFYLIMHRCN